MTSDLEVIRRIRASNRYLSSLFGLNARSSHGTEYSRVENRVLFEISQAGSLTVSELKKKLRLDAGYLSRVIQKLEAAGLVSRSRVASDGRLQPLRLTDAGRAVRHLLDDRADDEVRRLLAELSPDEQEAVAAAYEFVTVRLGAEQGPAPVDIRSPRPGEFGRMLELFSTATPRDTAATARVEAAAAKSISRLLDGDHPGGGAWVAEQGGRVVGAALIQVAPDGAEIAFLAVEPMARDQGIGSALLGRSVEFARAQAVSTVDLWLPEDSAGDSFARRSGFTPTEELADSAGRGDALRRRWTHGPAAESLQQV